MRSSPFQNAFLLPYEDLNILPTGTNEYQLHTPWLALQSKIEASPATHHTLRAYSHQDYQQVDWKILSDFLKQMNQPCFYISPETSADFGTDTLYNHIPAGHQIWNCEKDKARRAFGLRVNLLTHPQWEWDADAVLDFSKVGEDQYSPRALLSVVRRYHLLDCAENDRTAELYARCKSAAALPNPGLKKMLATIVYQNYFVTKNCQDSLAPALSNSQSAESVLEEFMSDEEGHDLLLLRALTSMGASAEGLYLAAGTENIMRLLRQIGSWHFLSFCLAIDFFEKPTLQAEDPLARLLKYFHCDIAADCLQKHKNINDGGDHDSISLDLIQYLKPISREDALTAIRFAEILSDEMTSVTRELIPFLNQEQHSTKLA
jgi:hypothetical protein